MVMDHVRSFTVHHTTIIQSLHTTHFQKVVVINFSFSPLIYEVNINLRKLRDLFKAYF